MPSYIPEHMYGLVPGSYREHGGPRYGLIPWPKHMQPRAQGKSFSVSDLEPTPPALPDINLRELFNEPERPMATDFAPVMQKQSGFIFLTVMENDRPSIATTIERLINMLDDLDEDPDLEPYLAGLHQGCLTDDREGEDGFGGDCEREPSLGWTAEGHMGKELPPVFGPDLEDDDSDGEPSLGAPEQHPPSWENLWGRSGELHHHRGAGSQERWAAGASTPGYDDCEDEGAQDDREPSLSWQEEGTQGVLRADSADYEADLGTTEEIDQVRRLELAGDFVAGEAEPSLGWAESHGKGIVGPQNCLDDREHADEREHDLADRGIADDDAMHSEEFSFYQPSGFVPGAYIGGGIEFRGVGILEARNMLRKATGQPPVEKLPDETIVRRFAPREDDVVMIPEIDMMAHYRAAHGHRS